MLTKFSRCYFIYQPKKRSFVFTDVNSLLSWQSHVDWPIFSRKTVEGMIVFEALYLRFRQGSTNCNKKSKCHAISSESWVRVNCDNFVAFRWARERRQNYAIIRLSGGLSWILSFPCFSCTQALAGARNGIEIGWRGNGKGAENDESEEGRLPPCRSPIVIPLGNEVTA